MKKCISRGIAFAAVAGLVLTIHAQDSTDQSQFPAIIQQPVDQCLLMGGPVTFSVQATNVDSYQWYFNNTALDGQTNSSLTIPNIAIKDVGYYFASVVKGSEVVPTRSACLNVYVRAQSALTLTLSGRTASLSIGGMSAFDLGGGGAITVFGAPVASSGTSGGCPGAYSGYVNYVRTISQGWGWAPTVGETVFTATDNNRSDTEVQTMGKSGDTYCSQTTVSVPNAPYSTKYRFAIYFPPNATVPTNAYPITLTGFDP